MRVANATRGTTVVDVTYECNARCRYCRWSADSPEHRADIDIEKVLIPAETLDILGTKRVVISGGEPRMHPSINEILAHYADLVEQVVMITNGYGLDRKVCKGLLDAGATGFTISLDSADPVESFLTRRTPPALHRGILRNIADIAGAGRDYEVGINSTVSSVTANWLTVEGVLEFGKGAGVDFVKFQPIFDDGYASRNSPDLLLGRRDVDNLLEVASRLGDVGLPPTNPPGFWEDVAMMAGGGSLQAHKCALGPSDAILVAGEASICYWVENSKYGPVGGTVCGVDRIRSGFEREKRKCNVEFHCFCNQGIDHTWS